MIRRTLRLILSMLLSGCSTMAPSLAPTEPLGTRLAAVPAGDRDELPVTLDVQLQVTSRQVQTLPGSWNTATLRLEHPSLPYQTREKTLTKGTGLMASGSAYVASSALGGTLRPRSGYKLTVSLWSSAANTTLVGEKQVTLNLVGGPNAVSVPIEVYPALGLTGFNPATASPGTPVSLIGQGFSVLPTLTRVSLGTAGDMQTIVPSTLASTSLAVAVPTSMSPGGKTWQVQVGSSTVTRAGFMVAGTLGDVATPSAAASQQQEPAIAFGNGQYLAAWTDSRAAGGTGIYGVRLTASGSVTGAEIAIASSGLPAAKPAVAYDGQNNRFLVVYESNNTIQGQLVKADGTMQGGSLSIAATTGGRSDAKVACDPTNGQYLVIWSDTRSGRSEIYGQRLALDGSPLGSNTLLLSVPSVAQSRAHVAYSSAANAFLVVSTSQSTPMKVMGRVVNPDGTVGSGVVTVGTGSGNQTDPAVAADAVTGDFLVVWDSAATGFRDNVMAQRVSSAGSLVGGTVTISSFNSLKEYPQIAYEPGRGTFLVAWGDARNSDTDLYAVHLALDGTFWGSEFPISTQPNAQSLGDVAVDATSRRGFVLFLETAGANKKVYGQQTYY